MERPGSRTRFGPDHRTGFEPFLGCHHVRDDRARVLLELGPGKPHQASVPLLRLPDAPRAAARNLRDLPRVAGKTTTSSSTTTPTKAALTASV
jgi:hypothetical protein